MELMKERRLQVEGDAEVERNRKLIESWSSFVKQVDPTVVIHVTFKCPVRASEGMKRFKNCCSRLNGSECKFFEKYFLAWIYLERNAGDWHFAHLHGLASGFDPDYAKALECRFDRELGRSQVDPYEPSGGITRYLAKKHPKNELHDYGLIRINSRYRGEGVYTCLT